MLDLSKNVKITQEALDERFEKGFDSILSSLIIEDPENPGEYYVPMTSPSNPFNIHVEKVYIGDRVYIHSRFNAGLILKDGGLND